MDNRNLEVATLSLIERENGSLRIIENLPISEREQLIFFVTVIKRDGRIFSRNSLSDEDAETRDVTERYDPSMSARKIAEHVFEGVRNQWERDNACETSV